MSDEEQRFILYMCFETDHEDEICRSLAVVSSHTEVEEWKREKQESDSADDKSTSEHGELESDDDEEEECDLQNPTVELSKLMRRFQETMSSYRHLVQFGMIMMPALRSGFIYHEMYKNARKNFEIIESDQHFETYGVTEDQYPSVQTQIRHLREFNRGVTVLPGAILLSLVATFDSFIADTLRIMLRHKPERAIASSKTIGVREVLSMSSFDDVISKIVENEVEALMRGSHEDQVKYVEDNLDIKIRSHYGEWNSFMEIFERRNLIAHGNYVITPRYVSNCRKHEFEIGDDRIGERLSLDQRYLRRSSDRLLEFGLSLMFVLWLKHFKASREKAYDSLSQRTYELIKDGQARVAAKLLDLALFKQTSSGSDRITKVMTVNLANVYRKLKNDEKAREIIAGVDWSATTDDFQICIAAVQEDVERVVELMPRVAQGDLLEKSDFREWPVFDWVREEKLVKEKFEELYGEPIIEPTEKETSGDQEDESATRKSEKQTIH